MHKTTRFIIGISLLTQSVAHMVLFIVLAAKKRHLWKAMLPIACTEIGLGTLMIIPEIVHQLKKIKVEDDFAPEYIYIDDDMQEIPIDEIADEEEFN